MGPCVNISMGAESVVNVGMSAWLKYVFSEVSHKLCIVKFKDLANLYICSQ